MERDKDVRMQGGEREGTRAIRLSVSRTARKRHIDCRI